MRGLSSSLSSLPIAVALCLAPAGARAQAPRDRVSDDEDANTDRLVLMPTATTHPRGTVYASDYEIVVGQLGFAPTDNTQISLTSVPFVEGNALIDITLKVATDRARRVRAAAMGSMSGFTGPDVGALFVGRAGGVVQACLHAEGACTSSLVMGTNITFAGPLLATVNWVGGVARVGRRTALIAEIDTAVPLGRVGGQFNGLLLAAGVRFTYPHHAFDLAIAGIPGQGAIPLVAYTFRFSP